LSKSAKKSFYFVSLTRSKKKLILATQDTSVSPTKGEGHFNALRPTINYYAIIIA
jgi:hypothetical protein